MPGSSNVQYTADMVVVGGGVGGCAAALAALENGHTVIMTEEYAWLGGQLTSQAVPPDEHGWIERFGCTGRYRRFRDQIRRFYRDYYPLRAERSAEPALNPGNGWVSPLCHEPKVSLAVLQAALHPYLTAKRLLLLVGYVPSAALTEGNALSGVVVTSGDQSEVVLQGKYFLDATENGDLLPLAGAEHSVGSEARGETGEPSAGATARPQNVQSISVCFVVEHDESKDNTIPIPTSYDHWRNYRPALTPPWPGHLLSWSGLNPRTMQQMQYRFHPHHERPGLFSGLWAFRRIADRDMFIPGFLASDLCLVNWPMIDYMEADILNCTPEQRSQRVAEAKQLSLSMLYWLQTEAPRPDGGCGWPGLKLRGDITGTQDGLAMAPYIREARRVKALHTIREQEVSALFRPGESLAERYEDSVGVGYYRIDLHPTTGGDNYIDVPSLPFRIPLGALIPVRMTNLLPAAKNIGTTHITNGCYRLHPVEWNIGESVALLASFCLRKKVTPHKVHAHVVLRQEFQIWIRAQGVETEWPEDINLEDGDPHAHAR